MYFFIFLVFPFLPRFSVENVICLRRLTRDQEKKKEKKHEEKKNELYDYQHERVNLDRFSFKVNVLGSWVRNTVS